MAENMKEAVAKLKAAKAELEDLRRRVVNCSEAMSKNQANRDSLTAQLEEKRVERKTAMQRLAIGDAPQSPLADVSREIAILERSIVDADELIAMAKESLEKLQSDINGAARHRAELAEGIVFKFIAEDKIKQASKTVHLLREAFVAYQERGWKNPFSAFMEDAFKGTPLVVGGEERRVIARRLRKEYGVE